jgi:hypothetical protein
MEVSGWSFVHPSPIYLSPTGFLAPGFIGFLGWVSFDLALSKMPGIAPGRGVVKDIELAQEPAWHQKTQRE